MRPLLDLCKNTIETACSLFYPLHCIQCKRNTEQSKSLCIHCRKQAVRIEKPFCAICSQPFEGEIQDSFGCTNCHTREFAFQCAIAPYRSRGIVREMIHKFKYEGAYDLRHLLLEWLQEGLDDPRLTKTPVDYWVPVPLHARRKREREFNQAEVLARLLDRHTGIPSLKCLKRIRYTVTQTRFDREERIENLRNAFEMRKITPVQGKHLVLIDDVLTTGSTMHECARILRQHGAKTVRALVIAR